MDDNRLTDLERKCPRKEDSTNNPYYNQPTSSPYRDQGFAIASMVCGILSMLSACTLAGPFVCTAFCILFASLAGRKRKPVSRFVVYGALSSMLGILSSISILLQLFLMK